MNVLVGGLLKAVFTVLKTNHFEEWFQKQDKETKAKVQMRLDRIAIDGHFGVTNFFDGIMNLNGNRVSEFIRLVWDKW